VAHDALGCTVVARPSGCVVLGTAKVVPSSPVADGIEKKNCSGGRTEEEQGPEGRTDKSSGLGLASP